MLGVITQTATLGFSCGKVWWEGTKIMEENKLKRYEAQIQSKYHRAKQEYTVQVNGR